MFSVSLPQSSNIFKRFKTIRAIGVSALRPTTAALIEMMIASVTNDGGNGDMILDARCCCQIYAIYPFNPVKKLVWRPRISVEKPQNPAQKCRPSMEWSRLDFFFVVRSCYMGASTNWGIPKWMVKIMEHPIKMDGWFGGFSHYFWKHPYDIG